MVPFSDQALRIYTKMDFNSALANYLDVGSDIDEQYLDAYCSKREENL